MTRVYFHTFGCKANQYDTELVRQALQTAGAVAVDDYASADVAVVNSCTVTHMGEAKMRGLVRRMSRANHDIKTVVIGCAASLDDGSLAALPGVHSVLGGTEPKDILSLLDLDAHEIDRVLRGFERGTRAWIKIQDGCDEHCTFCATTLARGANRSRPVEEIIEEAQGLAGRHAELVLTGVHIGTWGRDRGVENGLGKLLETMVSRVPEVRFRLSSIEATEVDDRIADLMAAVPERVAPHLHAPLQSGSDRILRLMGRHWYTSDSYRARLEELAARIPWLGLGADIIVGFPGESQADFDMTRRLVEVLPFTYLHVFPYSERPGAAARHLGPPTSSRISQARSRELRELAREKHRAYLERRRGTRVDVVLTRRHAGRFEGVTEDYLNVEVSTRKDVRPRFRGTLAFSDESDAWTVEA